MATPSTDHDVAPIVHSLVGHVFPAGSLRIERYEDWLVRDAVGAPTDVDAPHPSWALFGAFRGMGADLTEIFRVFGTAAADGVLFGETSVEEVRPLRFEHDYVVTSRVVDVQRKRGFRIPVFDLVSYVVAIVDDDGEAVRCCQTMVVPRAAA